MLLGLSAHRCSWAELVLVVILRMRTLCSTSRGSLCLAPLARDPTYAGAGGGDPARRQRGS